MRLNINSVSNKKYCFEWNDPMHTTSVEISIPDLTKLEYSVWADWGPMYTFELNEQQAVSVKYNNDSFDSPQKKLVIDSPMLASDRAINPFFIIIEDSLRSLDFHIYIREDGSFGKVEVVRLEDRVKLAQVVSA